MALKKQVILKSNFGDDVFFNNAYVKVGALHGDKKSLRIDVNVHKTEGGAVIDSHQFYFTPTLDGKNFIAQAYDYLKTLPEFAGATDC